MSGAEFVNEERGNDKRAIDAAWEKLSGGESFGITGQISYSMFVTGWRMACGLRPDGAKDFADKMVSKAREL